MCEQAVVRTPSVQNMSLTASGMPSSGPALPACDARVGGFRHRGGALRRLQHIGVERARLLHRRKMRVGQFQRGEAFLLQPVARRASVSEFKSLTAFARPQSVARAPARPWAPRRQSARGILARAGKAGRRRCRQIVQRDQQSHFAGDAHRLRPFLSARDPRVSRCSPGDGGMMRFAHHSTTFGTRKK